MVPPVTANAKVSFMAFKRAGSSMSVRKTDSKSWKMIGSVMLNTGSAACLAASKQLVSVALFDDRLK